MTTPRTKAEIITHVAAVIAPVFPCEAALLRGLKKPGPKSQRDEFGCTPHDYNKADLWMQMDDRIALDETNLWDVIPDVATRKGQTEDQILNLWLLFDHPEVKGILKRKGRWPRGLNSGD